jgi:hypothetical protein
MKLSGLFIPMLNPFTSPNLTNILRNLILIWMKSEIDFLITYQQNSAFIWTAVLVYRALYETSTTPMMPLLLQK